MVTRFTLGGPFYCPFLARGKCRYHPSLYQAVKRGCIIVGSDWMHFVAVVALRFDSPDDAVLP
jgi:hypothetical protein